MTHVFFTDTLTGKTYRSDQDLDLIIENISVGEAPVRFLSQEIPGADGVVDYSDVFGSVCFGPRPLTIRAGKRTLRRYGKSHRFCQSGAVQNALHGRMMKITLSDDESYYYLGRLSVGEWAEENGVGHVVITGTCAPWKYKREPTVVSASISDADYTEIYLLNSRMQVVPRITATAPSVVVWGGQTYALQAGVNAIRGIYLNPGTNTLMAKTLSGEGTLTIEYQEGSF